MVTMISQKNMGHFLDQLDESYLLLVLISSHCDTLTHHWFHNTVNWLLQEENLIGIREVPFTRAVPVYKNYSHKWMPKKNRVFMSAFGRINKCVLWWTLINVKWTNSKLSCGQMENWQKPIPFVCCPVKGHVIVDLHIKDKLCCQESILCM